MEEVLINAVRKRVCLYDVCDADYRDNDKRLAAWEDIGEELHMDPEKAKKEWEKLRRCFTNALHRRRHKRSLGDEARTMPPWKYEKEMSFLMPSYKAKRARIDLRQGQGHADATADLQPYCDLQSIKQEELSEEEDSLSDDPTSLSISLGSSTAPNDLTHKDDTKRKRSEEDNSLDDMTIPDCILREASPKRRLDETRDFDETDLFFLSLARTTKTLPVAEQARVKMLVSQAVFQAQISAYEPAAAHRSRHS